MLLTATPSEALQWIQTPRQILKERVVPAEFSHCPDSPFQPEYDWLFIYERRIAAFLEPWLKAFRYELIGEKGILHMAASPHFGVMYDLTGTVCFILHLFDDGMAQLVPPQKAIKRPA